jgi:hypothetical protein
VLAVELMQILVDDGTVDGPPLAPLDYLRC